ncbi:MAG TPA: 3,4-dihydroxy-2-butanone-4-phosphate synthase [Rhodanobacteraceae bacterium]|nr:3,4-dihydroxy-2-butanone-4-phosphate synthase [Rhodanobacteraceae bacterium]
MLFDTIPDIIDAIRAGEMVVMLDDERRENEGDLIMAASAVRAEHINFMAREGRGLICLALSAERCAQLGLQPMASDNTSPFHTNFMVSIEAAEGVTTGISAFDRARTIAAAVAAEATPAELTQPGHVFPLRAQPGGVLARAGHTEAGSDLARLAGLEPAAVLVEILHDDGSMARRPELEAFARRHGLRIGCIADLIRHRRAMGEEAPAPAAVGAGAGPDPTLGAAPTAGPAMPSVTGAMRADPAARFAIIASRWNPRVVDRLIEGARQAFREHDIADTAVDVLRVPGAWELPALAARLAAGGKHAAIVALGCVVRGETRHFEHVADGCANGLMQVATEFRLPVANGVLAVERSADAHARAGGVAGNKGEEAARVAIEMADLWRQL